MHEDRPARGFFHESGVHLKSLESFEFFLSFLFLAHGHPDVSINDVRAFHRYDRAAMKAELDARKARGDEVEAELRAATLPDNHSVKAIVVRHVAGKGRLALRFTELSDGAFALLEGLSTGRERRATAPGRRRQAPSKDS